MLNPFPILWMAMIAHALLRIAVAGILIYLGLKHLRDFSTIKNQLQFSWFPFGRFISTILILTELSTGTLILLGAHTQYAVLVVMLMCIKVILLRDALFNAVSLPPRLFYLLLFFTSLSLFITGAGVLAFDLPL